MPKNTGTPFLSKPNRIKPLPQDRERSGRREWEEYTRKLMKNYRRIEQARKDGEFLANADLTGSMEHRRTAATLTLLDEVYRRYGSSYPADSRNRLGELWIQLNYRFNTYTNIETESYILTAAAIWILDQIREDHERWYELMKLIPTDDFLLDEVETPDLWDPLYDWDLIAGVQYILQNRNGTPALDASNCPRCITDDVSASAGQKPDIQDRKNYEKLISLVQEEDLERAKKRFETLFWAFTDRIFAALTPLEERLNASAGKAEALRLEHNALIDELDETAFNLGETISGRARSSKSPSSLPGRLPDLNQLAGMTAGKTAFPFQPDISPIRQTTLGFIEKTQKLNAVTDRYNEAVDEIDGLYDAISKLMSQSVRQGYISDCTPFGEDSSKAMKRLDIGEPFEVCAGLLLQIDQGSDLPWAYGPGTGLMEEVCECLPWGVADYDEDEDATWLETDRKFPAKVPMNASMPDFNTRSYTRRYDDHFDFPRSISQLIYEETGCLLPRDMHKYDSRIRILKRYGVTGKDAAVALACMSFGAASRRQKQVWNVGPGPDAEDREQAEGASSDQLSALNLELKRMRSALHEAEKNARDAKKELQVLRTKAELDRRELADLREFVFNLDTEEPEEASQVETSFPYEVRKDTVIFGGHATWEKVIKPLLRGSVRFIDKDLYTFDPAIIRSADVVWIQPNAMSHTQYYRVLDIARQYKKPVRYFTHASAYKGAVQVMDNDLGQN